MDLMQMARRALRGWGIALFIPFACFLSGLFSCGKIRASAPDNPSDSTRAPAGDTLVTVMAVGDIMMGTTWPPNSPLPPNDGADLFRETCGILSAGDLTFGNLEGPLIDGGKTTKCGENSTDCYAFRTPVRYVRRLKEAGFDVVSLANNHAMDFGNAGRESTMRALDSAGILHSGPVGDVARLTIRGRRIALIAFGFDNDSHNLNDPLRAKKWIGSLKKECDILIVSFHGGAEGASRSHVPQGREKFLGEDRGDLRAFAHAAVDAGADLLLGHGPHVARGLELYRGRLIAYSLGNFATWERFTLDGPNGVSLILEASLDPDGAFHAGRIHPVRQQKPGGPAIDSTAAAIPILQTLSAEDFPQNSLLIDNTGNIILRR